MECLHSIGEDLSGRFDILTILKDLAPSTPLKTAIHCIFVCSSYTTTPTQPDKKINQTTTQEKEHTTPATKEKRRKVEWVSGGEKWRRKKDRAIKH